MPAMLSQPISRAINSFRVLRNDAGSSWTLWRRVVGLQASDELEIIWKRS